MPIVPLELIQQMAGLISRHRQTCLGRGMHCPSASTFNSVTARFDPFVCRTTQEVMGRFSRNLGNHRRVDQILEDWGSATVNLPLHHKVQKFSSGTGSPGSSRKKGRGGVVGICTLAARQ